MSRQSEIVSKLREMILTGDLPPGRKIAQVPVAEMLGASRTPVRHALATLALEGLVEPMGNDRGYTVRRATGEDMLNAVQLRGVLEGLSARRLAEVGMPDRVRELLESCIEDGEQVFTGAGLVPGGGERWRAVNHRFHSAIVQALPNLPVQRAARLNEQVPFASAGTIVIDAGDVRTTQRRSSVLIEAQRQHRAILRCLVNREGARVEALLREHCYLAIENIGLIDTRLPPSVDEAV